MAKGNPGAGRPAGSKNKRTLAAEALREKILASGKSPLEVMTDGMNRALKQAEKVNAELDRIKVSPGDSAEKIKALADLHSQARGYLLAAHECAKDAAPYLHPKLANIEVEGSMTLTLEDALAQL